MNTQSKAGVRPLVVEGLSALPYWAQRLQWSLANGHTWPPVAGNDQPIPGARRMSWVDCRIAAYVVGLAVGRVNSFAEEDSSGSTERWRDLRFAPCCWACPLRSGFAAGLRRRSAECTRESCLSAPTVGGRSSSRA